MLYCLNKQQSSVIWSCIKIVMSFVILEMVYMSMDLQNHFKMLASSFVMISL